MRKSGVNVSQLLVKALDYFIFFLGHILELGLVFPISLNSWQCKWKHNLIKINLMSQINRTGHFCVKMHRPKLA